MAPAADQPGLVGPAVEGVNNILPNRVDREVAGVVGDRVELAEYLDPIVPGAHIGPLQEDVDGWSFIDRWGVWECTLCEFPTMQDIPRVYREVWASALGRIFREIDEAAEDIHLERALKWLLILPKALFRQGRRGGKAGKGLIAKRVNYLVNGN